jgi:hypothetical protein
MANPTPPHVALTGNHERRPIRLRSTASGFCHKRKWRRPPFARNSPPQTYIMTNRSFDSSSVNFAVWNHKALPVAIDTRRIIVAHVDKAVGESLVLLFGLKGFCALYVTHLSQASDALGHFKPQALLLDTRVGSTQNYDFANNLASSSDSPRRLLIALSNFLPVESVAALKAAGYGAHCRRPCPVWQLSDPLHGFFAGCKDD